MICSIYLWSLLGHPVKSRTIFGARLHSHHKYSRDSDKEIKGSIQNRVLNIVRIKVQIVSVQIVSFLSVISEQVQLLN